MRQLFYSCPLTTKKIDGNGNNSNDDTVRSSGDTNDISKAIVVAFDDRAFVALDVSNGGDGGVTSSRTIVIELIAKPPKTTTTEKVAMTTTTEEEEQQLLLPQQCEAKNEICAVSMVQSSSISKSNSISTVFICTVARSDKTLSVYNIEESLWSSSSSLSSSSILIPPTMSYRSPKRVTAMTFGTLPSSSSSPIPPGHNDSHLALSNATTTTTKAPVLIATDVVGDAFAYSLGGVVRTNEVRKRGQKLLLGHTASMLTGVKMVSVSSSSSSSKQQHDFLLTSDRDEKIRISYWPETYRIHGYLLGHTEYVSAFDVAVATTATATATSDDATANYGHTSLVLAVSCGGDLTIRLWNVMTKEQLCLMDIDQPSNGKEKEKEEQQDQEPNENENANADVAQLPSVVPTKVPTDISINDSGTFVALIFDNCCEMDIYSIETVSTTSTSSSAAAAFSLSKVCSQIFPCQPLSIDFVDGKDTVLAVTQDPNYVVGYQIQQHGDEGKSTVSAQTDWDSTLDTLRGYGTSLNISMPTTILEKDEFGIPKLQRKTETRGPSGSTPWNRVERVEPMKERQSRKNKNKNKRKRQKTKATTGSTEGETVDAP